jgi:hypothetical protein
MTGPRSMLLVAAAVGSGACAPIAVPIHFHSPGAASGSLPAAPSEGQQQEDAVLGPLHVAASAGADFIEVRIRNAGSVAVLVDWSGSSFISPTGRTHALVTAEWLMDGRERAMPLHSVTADGRGYAASTAVLWDAPATAAHTAPTSLHARQQPLQRIMPGAVHRAVLYPAEHLVAGALYLHAGTSLLCDAKPAERLPVGLSLRWHDGSGWRLNEIGGTLSVRPARGGRRSQLNRARRRRRRAVQAHR